MIAYTIKRILLMIPTLLGVAVLVFFMLRVMPGDDVVDLMLRAEGANVPQHVIDAERTRLGLDQPVAVQFVRWITDMARGDLGISMWTGRPVAYEIGVRLELSLQVALMATVLAVIIALPLGTLSAIFKNTWIDHVIRLVSIAGLAIPSFWLGMLIILLLLTNFGWIPPITFTPFLEDPWLNLSQLIWPAMAVGYRYSAVATRMTRSSILEVMQEDYIRTARGQGRIRAPGRGAPRHAQRHAAGGNGHRARIRLPDRRAGGDRTGVQPQRHRPAVRPGGGAQRLHHDPVAGAAGVGVLHPDQLPYRHALRGARPAHQVQLMTTAADISYALPKRRNPVVQFITVQPLGSLGLLVIVVMCLGAAFAPWVAPHDPFELNYITILAAPSWEHPFGTDNFGRDVFSRVIYGARTALAIGFLSSLVGCTIGALIGVISAYFGGWVDSIVQRVMDVIMSFPIIVLALAVVAVLGKNIILGIDFNLIIAIGLPMIPKVARVVRSSALAIREMPYIDAARACGYSHGRIVLRHIVPNVVAPYLIMLTAFVAQAILLEASLSFLGLGVTEPTPSWGLMLSGSAADFYLEAPWMIIFPGVAISLAVFAFNLFGDSLRDWLDPKITT
jgi:peptide/nickel transport system permease protein